MAKAKVAPLAGAWIEMFVLSAFSVISPVAPLAGAWIEICYSCHNGNYVLCPLAGAWIEIRVNL